MGEKKAYFFGIWKKEKKKWKVLKKSFTYDERKKRRKKGIFIRSGVWK